MESLAKMALDLAEQARKFAEALEARAAQRAQQTPSPPAAPPHPPLPPGARHNAPVAPFGRNKGLPLNELADKDLVWLRDALQTSLSDPEKAAYAAKNARDLEAISVELRHRGSSAA